MLILKQNSANSVPTPPAGKGTIFLDDSNTLSVKTDDGNVENFPTVGASNTQVVFMNGTALAGDSDFTWNKNTNVLTVNGNVVAGNVKTDNLLYANGNPWDLQQPGGSNTQVQFNDADSFGGSANYVFDKTTNNLTVTGNIIDASGAFYGSGAGLTNIPGANVSGEVGYAAVANSVAGANVAGQVANALVAGTVTTAAQPNITSVGTLSALAVTSNVTAGNVYANSGTVGASLLTGTLTTASQPNITSVGTLSSVTATGNGIFGNVYANAGTIGAGKLKGEGGNISNIQGANVSGAVSYATTANAVAGANVSGEVSYAAVANSVAGANVSGTVSAATIAGTVTIAAQPNITSVGTLSSLSVTGTASVGHLSGEAGNISNVQGANVSGTVSSATTAATVTTAAQPNITSVGTLTSLDVTGNLTAGNIDGGNLVKGNYVQGTLTTAAQPNITSVGTLSSVTVTANGTFGNVYANSGTIGAAHFTGEAGNLSNITAGNITGQVANSLVAGTVYTAAQPNITSVGTLTSLGVNGTVTAVNITANTGVFTGNGAALTNLAGANVTGQVGNALVAGTVYTAAQPNITSVGTLTSATVTGNVAAGNLTTTGILSVTGTAQSNIAGNLSMTSKNIINVADPVNAQDAATKNYVDAAVTGLHVHAACYVATTGTLAAASGGTTTYNVPGPGQVGAYIGTTGTFNLIDGGNVQTVGTRILVKNEANAVWNGIYTYANTTALVRATDFDTSAEAAGGDFTFVQTGTVNADTGWVQTTDNPVLGTDNIVFTQFSGAGTYQAGTGLTLTGTTFSITNTAVTAGSYGNGDRVASFTVNAQGQLTAAANVVNAPNAANLTGTTLASGVVTSSLTSVGTLGSLAVTANGTFGNVYANSGTIGALTLKGEAGNLSNITGGNVTGQVGNALVAGTVYTAAQPNITSVGTLSSLAVTANGTFGNVYANSGIISAQTLKGDGGNISNIQGANVSGTVSSATTAGTVTTAAQPNITSVGTLSTLTVSGNATVGNLIGTVANGNSNVSIPAAAGNVNISVNGKANVAQFNNGYTTLTAYTVFNSGNSVGNSSISLNAANYVSGQTGSLDLGVATLNNNSIYYSFDSYGALYFPDGSDIQSGGGAIALQDANYNFQVTCASNYVELSAYEANYANYQTLQLRPNVANLNMYGENNITRMLVTPGFSGVQAANVLFTVEGVDTFKITQTGANITGTANVTGNANVGNLGTAGLIVATGNVTGGNLVTGGVLSVTGNANVGNLGTARVLASANVTAPQLISNVATGTAPFVVTSTTQVANLNVATAGTAGTVTTAAQPNITSVGTITGGIWNNNIGSSATFAAGLSGANLASITGANVTGTVPSATAATNASALLQNTSTATTVYPTFTTSSANGNAQAVFNSSISANLSNASITATTFVGALSGAATSATTAGTVTTAAQPNITSVGTLTGLTVSSTITGSVSGSAGTAGTVTTAAQPNITSVGTLTGLTVSSTITGSVSGSASSATTAGTVTTAAQPNITSVGTLTSLTVSGATSVTGNSALTVTNLTTGLNSTAGYMTGNWTLTAGSKLQATYADLAEKYVADADYEPGTVLVFGGDKEVTLSTETDSHRVAGVVSTNPAYVMNSQCEGEYVVDLALTGRVPVKVQGPVAKGDLMVSGLNGYAVANNQARAGTIIGKALENFNGETGVIEVVVGRV